MGPTRSRGQRTGDRGESFVHALIDSHPAWLGRRQDRDFGIDLEAELAVSVGPAQELTGKLIKIQVKGSEDWSFSRSVISVPLERDYLDYAMQFRIPVILVAADVTARSAYWVWLQDWVVRNEARLAATPETKTVTVHLPADQRLASGLDGPLQHIARGQENTTTVLALRELVEVARANRDQALFDGVMGVLGAVDVASRGWTIAKVIDDMIGLGPHAGLWRTSEFVPPLLSLVERFGSGMTREQVVSMVARGETYSRAALYGLTRLYDRHFATTAELGLPGAFRDAGVEEVAWYCAFREFYAGRQSVELIGLAASGELPEVAFEGLVLTYPQCASDDIDLLSKWANRGNSALLDRLSYVDPPSAD